MSFLGGFRDKILAAATAFLMLLFVAEDHIPVTGELLFVGNGPWTAAFA